jgi:flagellar hook-basal body complex protein FliE
MTSAVTGAVAGLLGGAGAEVAGAVSAGGGAPALGFAGLVDQALTTVSADQNDAATKEASYAAGSPGASLGGALVASDRAEVAWNATVAVRNEVVTAYQSIMNMQF